MSHITHNVVAIRDHQAAARARRIRLTGYAAKLIHDLNISEDYPLCLIVGGDIFQTNMQALIGWLMRREDTGIDDLEINDHYPAVRRALFLELSLSAIDQVWAD